MSKPVTSSEAYGRIATICLRIAWAIGAVVVLIALTAWAQSRSWHIFPVSSYQFFPLLGLLAFSIMWSHYAAGTIREMLGLPEAVLASYFNATSLIVLALICLHPGILIYQRFRDGYGLPPHSYESYVAPGMGWLTLLGTTSLLIFLAFEFRRVYAARSWWKYVLVLNDLAMLAILYHSLRLGSQLQQGWLRPVWFFYGLTLIAILIRSYFVKYQIKKSGHVSGRI